MFDQNSAKEIANKIYETRIPGLYFISIDKNSDHRGFYSELFRINELNPLLDSPFEIKQVNQSHSIPYVTRGFHAEDWNKLVVVTSGYAFCALVDIRPESPTFSQSETFLLGPEHSYGALFISNGIANSLCVPEKETDYIYFVDKLYKERNPEKDQAISLFDPDLNISWPIPKEQMIISQRDTNSISLRTLFPSKFN